MTDDIARPPSNAGAPECPVAADVELDLQDLVDSYLQSLSLLRPLLRLVRSRVTLAIGTVALLAVPAHLVLAAMAVGAAVALLVGNVRWSWQTDLPAPDEDWQRQSLVIKPPVQQLTPEDKQAERLATSVRQLRELLRLLAAVLDSVQGLVVEVERVRRWIDPRYSARVVWMLLVAAVALATIPFAQTLVCVFVFYQLHRAMRHTTTPQKSTPEVTRRQRPRRMSTGLSPDDIDHVNSSVMSSTGSALGLDQDLWVLVSGGAPGDDSEGGGDNDTEASASGVDSGLRPPGAFPSRIRDWMTEARDKRKAGVRCKACNQQVDTMFKRRVECSKCVLPFCSACCPPPRKGRPRLCKGCAAS
eukprot:m.91494 g.91494  ORF g.91494 m.91494 type:complete len:359 (-) comp9907_c0_seq2:939-2015(-)